MPFALLDDSWIDHPKILSAPPAVIAAHALAIAYSARYRTDGEVPVTFFRERGLVRSRAVHGALELVLFDAVDKRTIAVHDYLVVNRPRQQLGPPKPTVARATNVISSTTSTPGRPGTKPTPEPKADVTSADCSLCRRTAIHQHEGVTATASTCGVSDLNGPLGLRSRYSACSSVRRVSLTPARRGAGGRPSRRAAWAARTRRSGSGRGC